MQQMLELSRDFPEINVAAGEVILTEHGKTGRLYILAEGAMEVYRNDTTFAFVTEPGSIFGEMSLLLDIPHTANVRAAMPSRIRVIDDAMAHLTQNPVMLVPIAQLLARRLRNSNHYLVDLKRQFQSHSDHFGMVDEVLASLAHQQGERFTPAGELPEET